MSDERRRRLIFLVAAAVVLLVVAILARDIVRDYFVRPLLLSLWNAYNMSQGFPQVMVWAFFVATIPVIAVFNLIVSGKEQEPAPPPEPAQAQGQVQLMSRWLQQAPGGDYFRTRLFRHLSNVTLDTLGYRERLAEKDVRAKLRSGEMKLDPSVLEAVKLGWRKPIGESASRSRRRRRQNEVWQDPQVEVILQFLEEELEIKQNEG